MHDLPAAIQNVCGAITCVESYQAAWSVLMIFYKTIKPFSREQIEKYYANLSRLITAGLRTEVTDRRQQQHILLDIKSNQSQTAMVIGLIVD